MFINIRQKYVGHSNFNNLILLGRWWLKNLILSHIYKKNPVFWAISSAFAFKVCNKCCCDQKNKFSSKEQYGYQKPQNLMLISNPLKKCKKLMRKQLSTIKLKKNGVFDFILLCAKFFWEFFCTFFNGFKLSIKGSDQWEGRGCRRIRNYYMLVEEVVLDVFLSF